MGRRKELRKIIKSIKETLESKPKTIPQIAEETGMRSETVAWYLFSLYKYGETEEAEEEGEYYTYKLPEGAGAAEQKNSEKEDGNENGMAGDADED